jgi:hypothetical protein
VVWAATFVLEQGGSIMARLVVEGRTAEWTSGDVVLELLVGVSVSRADDGTPVTGLGAENFRVAAQFGNLADFAIDQVSEWKWEPGDVEPAGCYELSIGWRPLADLRLRGPGFIPPPPSGFPLVKGWRYVFGIQARTFDSHTPPRVVDQGQSIVEVISMGT